MQRRAVPFLKRWVVTTIAVLVAAKLVDGIHYEGWAALLVASLLLGFINAFVRPFLLVLSLPLLVVTAGLFYPVLNALLLWTVGGLVKGFEVKGFVSALWGALIMGAVSLVIGWMLGDGPKVRFHRRNEPPGSDGGPVIDV